jgi:hypothetical protein
MPLLQLGCGEVNKPISSDESVFILDVTEKCNRLPLPSPSVFDTRDITSILSYTSEVT